MISIALRRFSTMAAAGAALVLVGLAGASPAAAEDGAGVGVRQPSGMTTAELLLIFVGIPALIYAICFALVFLTANKDASAGGQWWTEADYYSGGSGSSTPVGDSAAGAVADQESAGGASARW